MLTILQKAVPQLICWGATGLLLCRAFASRRFVAALGGGGGFCGGVVLGVLLLRSIPGDLPFAIMRGATGAAFLLLVLAASLALYRLRTRSTAPPTAAAAMGVWQTALVASLPGLLAGMLVIGRTIATQADAQVLTVPLLVLLVGVETPFLAAYGEKFLPAWLTVSGSGLVAGSTALLALQASFSPRLDIFAPLTMKVMKFIHDFVHQFFESMLIPDHPFFREELWHYIGLLFGNEVGFWGGLVIWFAPVLAILWVVGREPLPSVAHLRQGALRRKAMAGYRRSRRLRLVIPLAAMLLLAAAAYESSFPSVEYWDPKPLAATVDQAGRVVIPRQTADYDLEDGKIHKFEVRRGNAAARVMVLRKPDGKLAVVLDACSICQPAGYGQAEGSVLCYYCKTLIPLETVGLPGGCNPVPLDFAVEGEAVSFAAADILNVWGETVQGVRRVPGGER